MIINSFRIKNFRSIIDSGECDVNKNRIHVLVGKNGSGKSAIIDALRFFNKNSARIPETDKPLNDIKNNTELTIKIGSNEKELGDLSCTFLTPYIKNLNTIIITKYFRKSEAFIYRINEEDEFFYINDIIKTLTNTFLTSKSTREKLGFTENKLPIKFKANYSNYNNLQHDLEALRNQVKANKPSRTGNNEKIRDYDEISVLLFSAINMIFELRNNIGNIIPDFIQFDYSKFSEFQNEIPYDKAKYSSNPLGQLIFQSMGLNFDEFIVNKGNSQRIEQLANKRDKGLENYLKENWLSEDTKFEMKFYPDRFSCLTMEKEIFPYISQRSSGEIWLFTFLIYIYSNVNLQKNTVILIDEPSVNLHPNAQRSIITIIEKLLNRNLNLSIIYTTHSPYLISPVKLDRIVQIHRNNRQGTYIKQLDFNKLCDIKNKRLTNKCTPETIKARLSQMLTTSMREGFFCSIVVLCEGPTEYLSLPIWAKVLNKNLDNNGIVVIGCVGKEPIIDYAEFFKMYSIPVFLIFDNDNKPEKGADHQKKHRKLNRDLLKFANGDIEDFPTRYGENYFVFDPEYEKCLRKEDIEYSKIEENVSNEYGTSRNKGIRARYVALEYQNMKRNPPESIEKLIEVLFKFQEMTDNKL